MNTTFKKGYKLFLYLVLWRFYRVLFFLQVKFRRPVSFLMGSPSTDFLISTIRRTNHLPCAISDNTQLQVAYRLKMFLFLFTDYFLDLKPVLDQDCRIEAWKIIDWIITPALVGLKLEDFQAAQKYRLYEWSILAVRVMLEQRGYKVRASFMHYSRNHESRLTLLTLSNTTGT